MPPASCQRSSELPRVLPHQTIPGPAVGGGPPPGPWRDDGGFAGGFGKLPRLRRRHMVGGQAHLQGSAGAHGTPDDDGPDGVAACIRASPPGEGVRVPLRVRNDPSLLRRERPHREAVAVRHNVGLEGLHEIGSV